MKAPCRRTSPCMHGPSMRLSAIEQVTMPPNLIPPYLLLSGMTPGSGAHALEKPRRQERRRTSRTGVPSILCGDAPGGGCLNSFNLKLRQDSAFPTSLEVVANYRKVEGTYLRFFCFESRTRALVHVHTNSHYQWFPKRGLIIRFIIRRCTVFCTKRSFCPRKIMPARANDN